MINTYRVVIKGARQDLVVEAVVERLAPLFKMTPDMVRSRLMSGGFAVKKAVDLATAEKYCAFLEQHGCVCAIEREDAVPAAAPASNARPTTAPAQPRAANPAAALALAPADAGTKAPALALDSVPAKPGTDANPPAASATAARKQPAEPPYEPPKDFPSFAGRFDMRQTLNKGAKKRHPLSGKGEITFTAQGLRIIAKRPRRFWFAAKEDILIPYAGILDARVNVKLVRFSMDGLGPERRDLCFAVADADTAWEIKSLLPQRQSDVFREFQDDEASFNESLDDVGTVPVVSYALLAINVAVFLVMAKKGVGLLFPDPDLAIDFGTNYGPLTLTGQWWRMAGACFIHFGILHLVFNMIALYNVVRLVEKLYGTLHFALLYAVAGLAGSMASLLWHPMVNSAGASGAIFGVFGGLLAYMLTGSNGVPRTIMEQHRNSMLVFVGYSLWRGFSRSGIDNAAHVGGLIGGLVMGYLLMRPLNEEARKEPIALKLITATLAGAVMLGLASIRLFHLGESVRQDLNFLAQVRVISKAQAKAESDYEALEAKVAQGEMTQLQMADPIEKQILPQWQAMDTQLSTIQLSASSSHHEEEQDMLRNIESEQRRLQQMVQAIRTNDLAALQRADDGETDLPDPQDPMQDPPGD